MEEDMNAIIELLKKDDPRVVAVVGMGGQGKTLLAQASTIRFGLLYPKNIFVNSYYLTLSSRSNLINLIIIRVRR
jgi:hypothetical protein